MALSPQTLPLVGLFSVPTSSILNRNERAGARPVDITSVVMCGLIYWRTSLWNGYYLFHYSSKGSEVEPWDGWSTVPSVTGPGEGPETCSPTASQLCAAALFSSAEVSAEPREKHSWMDGTVEMLGTKWTSFLKHWVGTVGENVLLLSVGEYV